MRIVQLLPELSEGGVERGVIDLNQALVENGHESVVISNGGSLVNVLLNSGGVHYTSDVSSKNPLSFFFRSFCLRRLLRKINPDIVHIRSRVPAWLFYYANKTLHIPVVSTVHGFNRVNWYSQIMTHADRIVCGGLAIKDYIKTHYHTSEDKMVVIPRGIDLNYFNPMQIDHDFIFRFEKKHRLENRYVVTSVGRITQTKDFETFIQAIAIAKRKIPSIVGLIVGGVHAHKQAYYYTLRTLCTQLGVESAIIFAGSQSQMREIYALSKAIISSSKKPETFGRTLVESLAMKTPVIATRHGNAVDIIQEGHNGLLFPVGDAQALASKIIGIRDLSFSGMREYVENKFGFPTYFQKKLGLYKEVGGGVKK